MTLVCGENQKVGKTFPHVRYTWHWCVERKWVTFFDHARHMSHRYPERKCVMFFIVCLKSKHPFVAFLYQILPVVLSSWNRKQSCFIFTSCVLQSRVSNMEVCQSLDRKCLDTKMGASVSGQQHGSVSEFRQEVLGHQNGCFSLRSDMEVSEFGHQNGCFSLRSATWKCVRV